MTGTMNRSTIHWKQIKLHHKNEDIRVVLNFNLSFPVEKEIC